ncbi:MAG: thiamine phosphate synthase [Thermodesulfovibrionales bacterium]
MYRGGLCFITDRTFTGHSPSGMVAAALAAGVTFIQYRDKGRTRREVYDQAVVLRDLTRRAGATLIINDHADIALAVDADGVHLGQDDLPLKDARLIMGDRIVGISTHSLAEAKAAEEGGADYIGFGPIFPTRTKDAGPSQGVDNLRMIKHNVRIPVVAIGGITIANAETVMSAGADCLAVATGICDGDIALNARSFVGLLQSLHRRKNA